MDHAENQDWLIIANGLTLSTKQLKALKKNRKVIALDGAVLPCIKEGIIPDIVLGDFDSLDRSLIDRLAKKHAINFIYLPDQDSTDLEKSFHYILKYKPKSISICQATGLRLDHSIHNLRLLRRIYSRITNIAIYTETEKVQFIKDKTVIIAAEHKEPMALLAFPEARITSKGLKFDMDNYVLKFAESESTSNHIVNNSARIKIKGEVLLIISHSTELIIA